MKTNLNIEDAIEKFLGIELNLEKGEVPPFSYVLNNDDPDSELEYSFWIYDDDNVSYFYPDSGSFEWNETSFVK